MNVQPDYHNWGLIKQRFEGLKLNAYPDTGKVPTIGFGTTYRYDLKRKVKMGDKITFSQAVAYWEYDSAEVVRLANVYIKRQLNASQSTAICDYIYNRGIGNFLGTTFNGWGLDEIINYDPNDLRIPQVIQGTGWRDKLGNLWRGLVNRRKCEAFLYRTGVVRLEW